MKITDHHKKMNFKKFKLAKNGHKTNPFKDDAILYAAERVVNKITTSCEIIFISTSWLLRYESGGVFQVFTNTQNAGTVSVPRPNKNLVNLMTIRRIAYNLMLFNSELSQHLLSNKNP